MTTGSAFPYCAQRDGRAPPEADLAVVDLLGVADFISETFPCRCRGDLRRALLAGDCRRGHRGLIADLDRY